VPLHGQHEGLVRQLDRLDGPVAGVGGGHQAGSEPVDGPVATVIPFDDEDDAVRLANATRYRLAGSVRTRAVGRAIRVSRAVAAGHLSVHSHNSARHWIPFGGFGESGMGRELGPGALAAFPETKNVFISSGEDHR
jgi:acyl-CoA reductase-like NAD-dependent aldehyde dehydrogenase